MPRLESKLPGWALSKFVLLCSAHCFKANQDRFAKVVVRRSLWLDLVWFAWGRSMLLCAHPRGVRHDPFADRALEAIAQVSVVGVARDMRIPLAKKPNLRFDGFVDLLATYRQCR